MYLYGFMYRTGGSNVFNFTSADLVHYELVNVGLLGITKKEYNYLMSGFMIGPRRIKTCLRGVRQSDAHPGPLIYRD